MLDDEDPYGNLDGVADAQWTATWGRWSTQELDKHFASVANWGPINIGQCEQLIQGLPPCPHGWMSPTTCLAQFTTLVRRLRHDIKQGALSSTPTAVELAAWCDQMKAALPEALVGALRAPASAPGYTSPQSPIQITLPLWVSIGMPSPSSKTKVAPRGRPRGASGNYDALVRRGSDILMEGAREGRYIKLTDIVKRLLGEAVGASMTPENVERRLKGNLPLVQAKETAAQVRARARATATREKSSSPEA